MNTNAPQWNVTHREDGNVIALPNVIRAGRATLFFGSHGAQSDFNICADHINNALPHDLKKQLPIHISVEHGLPKGAPTEVSGLSGNYENFCKHFNLRTRINWGSLLDPNGHSTNIPEAFKHYYGKLNERGVLEFNSWFQSIGGITDTYSAATFAERQFVRDLKNSGWSIRHSVEQAPVESALASYRSQIAFKKSGEAIVEGDLNKAIRWLARQAELEILRDELRDISYARLITQNLKPNEATIVVRGSAHQECLSRELSKQHISWASSTFLKDSYASATLKDALVAEKLREFSEAFLPHAYRSMNYQLLSNLVDSSSRQPDKENVHRAIAKILLSLDVDRFSNWFEEAKHQRLKGLSAIALFAADWTLRELGDRDSQLRDILSAH